MIVTYLVCDACPSMIEYGSLLLTFVMAKSFFYTVSFIYNLGFDSHKYV